MKKIQSIILIIIVLFSCSKEDGVEETLATYTANKSIETGAVIACAATDEETGEVLAFYYPEEGAANIRYYETLHDLVDSANLSNYSQVLIPNEPVFNGHLGKFTRNLSKEKWIIITFELDGEIKISNPIKTKQISKPTVWNKEVDINQEILGMPKFTWTDDAFGDNAIYFQVVTDENNNLLSGTYTYQNYFQYYKLNNVVLNVTTQVPPNLVVNNNYFFTLMDVSLDNWVNLVIQRPFIAK